MTINDTHEALTELCEAMKGRETLREQLKDIFKENRANTDLDLAHIAKQMDALLEECGQKLKHDYWHNDIRTKLKQAGYGQ